GTGEQRQRQTAPPWRLSIGNRPSLVADGGAGGSGKGRGGGRSGSGRGGSRTRGRGPPPRRPYLAGSGGDVHNGRRRHWRGRRRAARRSGRAGYRWAADHGQRVLGRRAVGADP